MVLKKFFSNFFYPAILSVIHNSLRIEDHPKMHERNDIVENADILASQGFFHPNNCFRNLHPTCGSTFGRWNAYFLYLKQVFLAQAVRVSHVSLPIVLSREASISPICHVHIEYRLSALFNSAMVSYLTIVTAANMSIEVSWGRKFVVTFVAWETTGMVNLMATWFEQLAKTNHFSEKIPSTHWRSQRRGNFLRQTRQVYWTADIVIIGLLLGHGTRLPASSRHFLAWSPSTITNVW